jgi:hypothetical protein
MSRFFGPVSSLDDPLNDHESRLRFRRADLAARPGRCDPPTLAPELMVIRRWYPLTGRLGAEIRTLALRRGEWGPA